MKTETPKITLPASLKITVLSKWLEKDSLHFKLKLSNEANGRDMSFAYSGGCLAFLPSQVPPAIRSRLGKPVRTLWDEEQKDMALSWALSRAVIDPCGVIYSLLSDTQAGQESFSDFCGNFGYDEDSRKAESTWNACRENGRKFMAVVGDLLPELEKLLREY